jgi:hypothetical protein
MMGVCWENFVHSIFQIINPTDKSDFWYFILDNITQGNQMLISRCFALYPIDAYLAMRIAPVLLFPKALEI